MNKVAIISIAWGNKYKHFVPSWYDHVQALKIKPDEIIVAYHPEDDTGVENLNVKLVKCYERSYSKMLNAAIEQSNSDWIIQCPLDDMILPNALDFVNFVEKDIDVVLTCRRTTKGDVHIGDWSSLAKKMIDHRVCHTSPFKKSLWEKVKGFPDYILADWAFFLLAYKENVKVKHWGEVTVLSNVDDNSLGASNEEKAWNEIIKLRQDLNI